MHICKEFNSMFKMSFSIFKNFDGRLRWLCDKYILFVDLLSFTLVSASFSIPLFVSSSIFSSFLLLYSSKPSKLKILALICSIHLARSYLFDLLQKYPINMGSDGILLIYIGHGQQGRNLPVYLFDIPATFRPNLVWNNGIYGNVIFSFKQRICSSSFSSLSFPRQKAPELYRMYTNVDKCLKYIQADINIYSRPRFSVFLMSSSLLYS